MNAARLALLGVVIIFVGFLVVVLGAFTQPSSSSSSGGFILIGPIPIVFGSGPYSGTLATVAVVIGVAMVVFYLVSFFVWRSARRRQAEIGTKSE